MDMKLSASEFSFHPISDADVPFEVFIGEQPYIPTRWCVGQVAIHFGLRPVVVWKRLSPVDSSQLLAKLVNAVPNKRWLLRTFTPNVLRAFLDDCYLRLDLNSVTDYFQSVGDGSITVETMISENVERFVVFIKRSGSRYGFAFFGSEVGAAKPCIVPTVYHRNAVIPFRQFAVFSKNENGSIESVLNSMYQKVLRKTVTDIVSKAEWDQSISTLCKDARSREHEKLAREVFDDYVSCGERPSRFLVAAALSSTVMRNIDIDMKEKMRVLSAIGLALDYK